MKSYVKRLPLSFCIVSLLAACAAGPDYQRPTAEVPVAWTPTLPWHEAHPEDASLKGDWWEIFHDADLDQLVRQAISNGQTLRMAAAHLEQARAQVNATSAGLWPSVGLTGNAARQKTSANRPLNNYALPNTSTVQNDFKFGLTVNYEADLSGRIRRQIEGAQASAEQSQADFENTRLLLASEVAVDYFSLRELDAEISVVRESMELQRRALDFVTARHDLGAASGLDLAQQQAVLDASTTQIDLLRNQRDQYEHALATLVGVPAPSFALPPAIVNFTPPAIPVGVPSDLLQRRPDVASAERAMAAANAAIGVAHAAYFPALMLAPTGGWESNAVSGLLNAPSLFWSLGLAATQTLFDGGRRSANEAFARAGYDAAVANYRQTVLTALQEVENGVTGSDTLARAQTEAEAATGSAQRALDIANARYSGGLATYLDVITAQQILLTNQRQSVQIRGQQLLTSVYLVKALGGGWQVNAQTQPADQPTSPK